MRIINFPIYIVQPFERGIKETLGRYTGFVQPGPGLQLPFLQKVRVRDVREHTMDIPTQPVITKDNVEIRVDGVMWVRPAVDEESIKRTFYNIDNWKRAIIQLAMIMSSDTSRRAGLSRFRRLRFTSPFSSIQTFTSGRVICTAP